MKAAGNFEQISNRYKKQLQAMEKLGWPARVANRGERRRLAGKIQAIQEAQRDILNTAVVGRISSGSVPDKNNYTNYEKQVDVAYKMYDGLTEYGSEVLSAVVDIRVAFIAGEGVSFYSKNEAKTKAVKKFLTLNSLSGSRLLAAVLMGELEGKALFVLANNEDEQSVDARLFSWYANKYKVERDKQDYEKITVIKYTPDNAQSKEQTIDIDKSVWVKLGGCDYKTDKTPTKIGKVLTQCENASRAAYDLRKNTHLFGRIFPYWETADGAAAKVINDALSARSFEIGDSYAGTAKMTLLEPSGSAGKVIIDDMLNSLRFVSAMTGVPIHWLAWPELMSNRATAENMLEVVSANTKKERLIWEESLRKLLDKVLQMAVDAGYETESVLEGEYDLRLPLISLASMQQLIDVWMPLYQEKLVSAFTMRNMMPGIDPEKEAEQIDVEREEAAERSPMQNTAADELVKSLQQPPVAPGQQPQVPFKKPLIVPKKEAPNA